MVYLYQDRENKTIEQNDVFVKWKQSVSNLQNNGWTWVHMNWGHEKTNYYYYWYLKLEKCDFLMTIICLIPFGHLLLWYLLVLVWHTKQFGQFKLLSISLHNATTTSWCIGVLRLLVLNNGFPNKQCVCCYQTWVKYIIYCSFPLQTGGRGKLQRLLMRTKRTQELGHYEEEEYK
jgi:hypothetical protein